jgi:hypothetical protein
VAFEDLRIAGEEKDTSVLQLQREAEALRADLKKEKKQVEGKLWPLGRSFVSWFCRDLLSSHLFFLPGLWTSLGLSAMQVEVLHAVYNSSQQDLVLTVKIRQPSHEFTFGVGISFIPYPLVLTPVV